MLKDSKTLDDADEVAQEAHEGAHHVYEFYLSQFGRKSLDNKGQTLISSVHYDLDYNNAFWDGVQMVYGDGDGKLFTPFTNAIDVVGHELSHGLIQNTSNLIYFHQSGAANESFADIFGITLKHYLRGESNPNKANWLVGDEIVGTEFPGKAIRTFKNEKAYEHDTQPKHMKNYLWTFKDNGGVHTNSGVLNHAFYLICLYMDQPSYGKPVQIMYNTLINLTRVSNFWHVAFVAVQQTEKIYGKNSPEVLAVKKAYKDVGVL